MQGRHLEKVSDQKKMNYDIREEPLSRFDPEPGPFTMSYGFSTDTLARSIEAVGMIQPPLVLESSSGPWPIVCGFRRIMAARRLGLSSILCRVAQPEKRTTIDWVSISLYDNLGTRGFNPVEAGMALARLALHRPIEDLRRTYAPLLGLPPRTDTVQSYIAMASALEPPLKDSLASGVLSVHAARVLLDRSAEERSAIHDLITILNLSFNNQIQLIDLINDIMRIESIEIGDLLGVKALGGILKDTSFNGPQRGKAALAYLKERRSPRFAAAAHAFHRKIARLSLPKGARLQAPPFFEEEVLRLELVFKNGRELLKMLRDIQGIERLEELRLPSWKEML